MQKNHAAILLIEMTIFCFLFFFLFLRYLGLFQSSVTLFVHVTSDYWTNIEKTPTGPIVRHFPQHVEPGTGELRNEADSILDDPV